LLSIAALSSAIPTAIAEPCLSRGEWRALSANGPRAIRPDEVLAGTKDAGFVLLGEEHDNPDHHRWQLHSLAMLHAARGQLVIGMEMLPRQAQPVLDRWVSGGMSEASLLRETQWNKVWGFDPDLYLPILHFARLHRVPLVALNVNRELIREVSARGWKAIPNERREGVGDPSPPNATYREQLRSWYEQHGKRSDDDPAAFERFVEAQLTWDRAFAEALAGAATRNPGALVAGIIGSGHLLNGYGVPHQLRAMGAGAAKVWLPVSSESACSELTAGLADAVFAVGSGAVADRPRLGVLLDEGTAGPRVREVVSGSVAERAGVQRGDRVMTAAGLRMASASDLIALIKRQPPGTWLPIMVERSGQEVELVAKFPAATE
jgi:uncharacterized iron-regulated protein